MVITVKLIGALRHLSGRSQFQVNNKNDFSLRHLIEKMSQEMTNLKSILSDQELNDSNSNSLILINGIEISVLNGFETKLCDGDEIVFVPVVHGG